MESRVWALIIVIILASSFPISESAGKKNLYGGRGGIGFGENYTITTQQDFENGSYDPTVDTQTYPGSITLKNYTYNYTTGKLDTPNYNPNQGYTILPGDTSFVFSSPGIVTSVSIQVGSYWGSVKIKILRRTNTGLWYTVNESPVFSLSSNTINTFNVNLSVDSNDRLGVYIISGYLGQISIMSTNTDTGYWYYLGDVGTTPTSMNWESIAAFLTIQAQVTSEMYYKEGNWTSKPVEFKTVPQNITISWGASIPPGAGIMVYARTSPDGNVWTPWELIGNNSSPSIPDRIVEVKVTLLSDGAHIPLFHYLKLNSSYVISLIINEFSSYGSNEWVEIKNAGNYPVNLSGILISDQDSFNITLSPTILNSGEYYVINLPNNSLNDNGDDILLSYENKTLDYISYASSPINDINSPPVDANFVLNGDGYCGNIPAPNNGESASLIPDGVDMDEASMWHITPSSYITKGSKNPAGIFIKTDDKSPTYVYPGDEVTVMYVNLKTYSESNITLSSMVMESSGTINLSQIENVSVYEDRDNSGDISPWDKYLGGGRFYTHTTYINLNISFNKTTNLSLIITVKFSSNATPENYVLFTITDFYSPNGISIFKNSPSTGKIFVKYPDTQPPTVSSLTYSIQPPFGKGVYYVYINFSEDMNTTINPVVKYGSSVIYYSSGNWVTLQLWAGKIEIYDNSPSGEYFLTVSGAEDIAGNVMVEYTTSFYVDTQNPSVQDVSLRDIVGMGENMVIVNFTEDMDTSQDLNVVCHYSIYERKVIGSWISPRSWEGTLLIEEEGIEANATLVISGGKDTVNNSMERYVYSFFIDTLPPAVENITWSKNPILGKNDECSVNIIFSEKVVNFEALINNVTLSITKKSDREYAILINTSQLPEGIFQLELINLTDLAGNIATIKLNPSIIIDKTPPEVKVVGPKEIMEGKNIDIYVYANDSYGIGYVILTYSTGSENYTVYMNYSGGVYHARIPGYIEGGDVKYRVYVVDLAGNFVIEKGVVHRKPSWSMYSFIWIIFLLFYSLPFIFEFLIRRGKK